MPIKIPDTLPATQTLIDEGVMVMAETEAARQDIRPLRVGLLNLMPNKIETETQIARLIGATPLQVELTLVRAATHEAKTTSHDHLTAFYRTWSDVERQKFDGFIVTGAPVGMIPYEDITYWEELRRIFDWTATHVHSPMFVCWGAMAALYHFHRIQKHRLTEKAFGVYPHTKRNPRSCYLTGFSDSIQVPVSRWTSLDRDEVAASGLEVLLDQPVTGPCLIHEAAYRRLYMINHLEYDTESLAREFRRDRETNPMAPPPRNYFPEEDPGRRPANRWKAHAHLLFGNWLNATYQTTPFDIQDIGAG